MQENGRTAAAAASAGDDPAAAEPRLARVPFAAAEDWNYFRALARVHERHRFPYVSLLVLGGLAALFGLACLTAALIAGLSEGMDTWVAALIVGVIYLAGAGIAAVMGREKIREATPLAPEQAVETTKEDVQWAKTQIRSETR